MELKNIKKGDFITFTHGGAPYYRPEDWPFYRTFAKVLQTLKLKIRNDDFKWDEGFLNEMMERTDR